MRIPSQIRLRISDERGTVMITMIFFLFCIGGLLSLLLFQGQAHFVLMNAQHTADIISKGARAAGKWEYVDSEGKRQTRLFATTEEAIQAEAQIVRGAREEAEILWNHNRFSLERGTGTAVITHQKGEKPFLYRQGIYYVRIGVDTSVSTLWGGELLKLERVSQSGTYK